MAGDEMGSLLRWATDIGVTDAPFPSQSPETTSPLPFSCLGHSLLVSSFPDAGGRGLAAARELREGELVLRVPRPALLTTDSVLMDQDHAARHPRLSPTQMLTICLLAEVGKGRGSRWYPYLVHLPRSYETLENFTCFEIQALQVEDAMWVSEKAVLKAKSDWKEAIILMQEIGLKPKLLTFRAWLWASATISSRTLHIPWDAAGCLCPIGDLFNYAAPGEESCPEDIESTLESLHSVGSSFLKIKVRTEELDPYEKSHCYSKRLTDGGYDEDTDSYCFYARKIYQKGEQVLLSYGTYTNIELLEHYGFLLSLNLNDKAFILLDTDIYIQTHSFPEGSLYIHPNGSPSFALLCALRLWATPINRRKAVSHLAHTGSSLSNENELFVMEWLEKHCRNILREFPSTIEYDESLMEIIGKMIGDASVNMANMEPLSLSGDITNFFQAHLLKKGDMTNGLLPARAKMSLQRWRLAIQWRLMHKRMILNCISHCNRIIENLCS